MRITRGWKLHVAPAAVVIPAQERRQSVLEDFGGTFPHVPRWQMVGTAGHRCTGPSIFSETSPPPVPRMMESRNGWTDEFTIWCSWVNCQQLDRRVAPGNLAIFRALTNRDRRPPLASQELSQDRSYRTSRAVRVGWRRFLCVFEVCSVGYRSWTLGDDRRPFVPNLGVRSIRVVTFQRCHSIWTIDGGLSSETLFDVWWREPWLKQVAKKAEKAAIPFQYAVSTRSRMRVRCTHPLTGLGAHGLISRNAMLVGLLRMEGGDQILPFARLSHGTGSTYLWEDVMWKAQGIPQGEGGEQATPSCQCCSLG